MKIPSTALVAILGLTACTSSAPPEDADQPPVIQSALHDFRVVTFVDGLVHPFAMAFTSEGDMLVTERPGRLRIVRDGVLLPRPVEGLPDILALGQGAKSMDGREQAGLRDVVLHPDFATNRLLYISYTKPGADSLGSLAVARGRFRFRRGAPARARPAETRRASDSGRCQRTLPRAEHRCHP